LLTRTCSELSNHPVSKMPHQQCLTYTVLGSRMYIQQVLHPGHDNASALKKYFTFVSMTFPSGLAQHSSQHRCWRRHLIISTIYSTGHQAQGLKLPSTLPLEPCSQRSCFYYLFYFRISIN
jgi:hypothetical protein